MSEMANTMNKHPVDTLRNVGRKNVNKLAILLIKPKINEIKRPQQ